MLPKKLRVPAVIAVATIATVAAASACERVVCKEGDPNCTSSSDGGRGGAGGSSVTQSGVQTSFEAG